MNTEVLDVGFGLGKLSKVPSMNAVIRNALVVAAVAIGAQAAAQITFYVYDGFQGRSFATQKPVSNFERYGFDDRATRTDGDRRSTG